MLEDTAQGAATAVFCCVAPECELYALLAMPHVSGPAYLTSTPALNCPVALFLHPPLPFQTGTSASEGDATWPTVLLRKPASLHVAHTCRICCGGIPTGSSTCISEMSHKSHS